MCLHIAEVPDLNDGEIYNLDCWKMVVSGNHNSWVTPYKHALIPESGILVPSSPSRRATFLHGNEINGGFIHALCDHRSFSYYPRKLAIAIDVVAFGGAHLYERDLICRALYIPSLDLRTKEERGNLTIHQFSSRLKRAKTHDEILWNDFDGSFAKAFRNLPKHTYA